MTTNCSICGRAPTEARLYSAGRGLTACCDTGACHAFLRAAKGTARGATPTTSLPAGVKAGDPELLGKTRGTVSRPYVPAPAPDELEAGKQRLARILAAGGQDRAGYGPTTIYKSNALDAAQHELDAAIAASSDERLVAAVLAYATAMGGTS